MSNQEPATSPVEEPSSEQVLASLQSILASGEFAESAQLSRFLRYIVEGRLAGDAGSLKESAVGVAVFRRGPTYNPKVDPIVRVEARRLRARLMDYYRTGGAADPVRISLPKGGYSPIFEARSSEAAIEVLPDLPAQIDTPQPTRISRRTLAAILIAAAVVSGATYLLRRPERPVPRFWSSILQGDRPALIVTADTGLVILQDLVHKPVQLQDYITGEYRSKLAASSRFEEDIAGRMGERRYVPFADLEFAVRLGRRPEAARHGIATRFARDVRVEDVRGGSVILLGPRHMNPWVELFEKDATFRLDHDEATASYRLVNTRPGQDEPGDIEISTTDVRNEIYGVINYHRNREGAGYILMLSGTSVAGTQAAADLILDEAKLLPWLRKAGASGELHGFDLLLHSRNFAGKTPTAAVVGFHPEK